MQLLRDNLTLWTSDTQQDDEPDQQTLLVHNPIALQILLHLPR